MLSRHEQKICDSLFPYTFIMDNKHVMTFYSITSKLKHWLQNHKHLLSPQVKFSFPLPAPHSQGEETFRTKETFSVCLFIPLLAQYLFTPVTHLFFFFFLSLQLALPCGFLSHTGAAAERKRFGWPSETNYGGAAATQKLSDGWGSCIYSWGNWQHSDTHVTCT